MGAKYYTIDFTAGGYPLPTYRGRVSLYAFDDFTALHKARSQIERDFHKTAITMSITKRE